MQPNPYQQQYNPNMFNPNYPSNNPNGYSNPNENIYGGNGPQMNGNYLKYYSL
jgi:hypothetical protein